jgi:hypothetical protein
VNNVNSQVPLRAIAKSVQDENLADLDELLAKHPDMLLHNGSLGTWLHMAARQGSIALMEHLVAKGIPINISRQGVPESPLHLAAAHRHIAAVDWLLSHGADPNGGPIPVLADAVYGGSLEVVELLVHRGAMVDCLYGAPLRTPLDAAISQGRSAIAQWLRNAGAQSTLESPTAHGAIDVAWIDAIFDGVLPVGTSSADLKYFVSLPSEQRSCATLFTAGHETSNAEVSILEFTFNLPSTWFVHGKVGDKEISALELMAGLRDHVHSNPSLLTERFIIVLLTEPFGRFDSALLLPRLEYFDLPDGRSLSLLDVVPLYAAERLWEQEVGVGGLLERFKELGISPVFDPARTNAAIA